MKIIPILVILIFLFSFVVSSCGVSSPSFLGGPTQTPDPCSPTEVTKYIDAIEGVGRRFDDAFELANNTARGSLSPVIGDLQEIRRDAEDLDVPECASEAQRLLVVYMDGIIEGFLLFLSNQPDGEVNAQFEKTSLYFKRYLEAISDLSE